MTAITGELTTRRTAAGPQNCSGAPECLCSHPAPVPLDNFGQGRAGQGITAVINTGTCYFMSQEGEAEQRAVSLEELTKRSNSHLGQKESRYRLCKQVGWRLRWGEAKGPSGWLAGFGNPC